MVLCIIGLDDVFKPRFSLLRLVVRSNNILQGRHFMWGPTVTK